MGRSARPQTRTGLVMPPISLLVILAKYGLDGRKDTQATSNSLNGGAQDDSLGDPRLEKLWHKVPLIAFHELQKLHSLQELRGTPARAPM